jgi:multiple sugar transport system ATP-binding protein
VDAGSKVVWGARPEYLRWASEQVDGAIRGQVEVTENLGATVLLSVISGDHQLQVVVPEENAPQPGDQGWISSSAHRSLLFDPDSTERFGGDDGGRP